jgi:hypothetical protein
MGGAIKPAEGRRTPAHNTSLFVNVNRSGINSGKIEALKVLICG